MKQYEGKAVALHINGRKIKPEDIGDLLNRDTIDLEYMNVGDNTLSLKGLKTESDVFMYKADIGGNVDLTDTVVEGTIFFNDYGENTLEIYGDIIVEKTEVGHRVIIKEQGVKY